MPVGLREGTRVVLHVGCGPRNEESLHPDFRTSSWHEVRLDIDASVEPDIVGTITDMHAVPSESAHAVWSSHNIEHVHAHEIPAVFREFFRVVRPGGFVRIATPDLQHVAERIARGLLDEPFYTSPAGPIAPLDLLYGHTASVVHDPYMAHKTGFTARSLTGKLRTAGFHPVEVQRENAALFAIARRPQ